MTMGPEAGKGFGVSLDVFTEQIFEGLASGKDPSICGSFGIKEGDMDTFWNLVDTRRRLFDWLSPLMRVVTEL